MAKAQFHKHQRVFVKPVGTWAMIENVVPQWAKGVDEPIRIHYDCGLGREFGADELELESTVTTRQIATNEEWRVIRCPNKWTTVEESKNHPFPGTYPVIVTGPKDWGGWRVPGAEYDLDPRRIEVQARLMAHSLKFVSLLNELIEYVEESPENVSNRLVTLAQDARSLVTHAEAT